MKWEIMLCLLFCNVCRIVYDCPERGGRVEKGENEECVLSGWARDYDKRVNEPKWRRADTARDRVKRGKCDAMCAINELLQGSKVETR